MKHTALLLAFFASSSFAQMNCLIEMLNQDFIPDVNTTAYPTPLYEFNARKVPVVMRKPGLSSTQNYIGFQGAFENTAGIYLIDEAGRASFLEVTETDSFIFLSSAYPDGPEDSRLTIKRKGEQLSIQAGWTNKANQTNIVERKAMTIEPDNAEFQVLLESLVDNALPDYIEACEINEFDESRDYKKPKLISCLHALKTCQLEAENADLDSWFEKITKNRP